MAVAELVLTAVLTATVLACATWLVLSRRAGSPLRPRARVVVNLTDGSAVVGVLLARTAGHLLLAESVVHAGVGAGQAADGQVLVGAERVLYVQVLPSREVT